ncbi:hypothetical protein FOZ60_003578 [Perkinsus olseni]|uniref:Phosphatidylinositol-specific phospholipase C X domain-containing protein n=1 Tax=Perkinsus olseni TaxID=32597 RepID=A0A7J6NXB1_PEROL|nr:hypothetical protein FOZ60_003578 [Perkinsus olseni]
MTKLGQSLVICIQATSLVAAQQMGRLLYTLKNYRMAFDIYEDFYVGFTFEVAGQPAFVDGLYHLNKSIATSYILDLSSSELCNWYTRMTDLSPEIGLKAGDLITSIYRGSDTMITKFQGRDVRFVRVTYPLVGGTFLHPDEGEKAIRFDITSDAKVSITLSCGVTPPVKTQSGMALTLRESPHQTPRSFYNVAPESMSTYNKFIAGVQTSCPGLSVTSGSLEGLIFVSHTSATSPGPLREKGEVLLNEWPMLMSHDSGTGYISKNTPLWQLSKTQDGDFTRQLNCGVRAFDLRLSCKADGVYMHHGKQPIDYKLEDAVKEIKVWAAAHPEELILLANSHYSPNTSACRASVWSVLTLLELMKPIGANGSCKKLQGLTVNQAMKISELKGGGHVFVVEGEGMCVDANYNASLTCWRKDRNCHQGSPGSEDINRELFNYINATASKQPKANHLAMNQAHWQYDFTSLTTMLKAGSNILNDTKLSGVNKKLIGIIPQLEYINLLEVDNACLDGVELAEALKARRKNLGQGQAGSTTTSDST